MKILPGTTYALPDCNRIELSCEHTEFDILPSDDGSITLRSSTRRLMVMRHSVTGLVEIAEAEAAEPSCATVVGGGALAIGAGAMAAGAGGVAIKGDNHGTIIVPGDCQVSAPQASVATLHLPPGVMVVVSVLQDCAVRDKRKK